MLTEKGVGQLQEDAGPIAGFRVAAASAAMLQILQDLESIADEGMALLAFDVRDEADAARIALEARVVEPVENWP